MRPLQLWGGVRYVAYCDADSIADRGNISLFSVEQDDGPGQTEI